MHVMNEHELERLHRDDLMREVEKSNLSRRLRAVRLERSPENRRAWSGHAWNRVRAALANEVKAGDCEG